METFHEPLREIHKRFTKSDLAFIAWRSQEVHAGVMGKMRIPAEGKGAGNSDQALLRSKLPEKYFNKDGELDLSQLTGEEAYQYFQSVGLRIPRMEMK